MIIIRISDYKKRKRLHTLQPHDQEYRERDLQGPKKEMNIRKVRLQY